MLDLYTINPNELTKANLAQLEQGFIQTIEDGNVDPLEMHIKAKALVKVLEGVIKKTDEIVREEADKYGSKTFTKFTAMITQKQGSVTPNYEEDKVFSEINEKLKFRKDQLNTAFKLAEKKGVLIDESTGEQVPVCSPKYAKSSISIQFK